MIKRPGRPAENRGRNVISVTLPDDTMKALEKLATRDGYRVAQLARLLIQRGLKKEKGEGK